MPESHPPNITVSVNSDLAQEELIKIIESMHDTYYRTNNHGLLTYLSKSVADLIGYKAEDVLGTKLSDYYIEQDGREKFLEYFQASGGNVYGYEAALRHKNGKVVWLSTNAHVYRGKNGEILGIEGTTRDVTAQKMQQQELNQLKNTLDKTLDCVFMFYSDSMQFFYMNEGAVNQIGYSPEELLSMTPYDIKPDYDEKNFRALVQPLIDGHETSTTFETVHQHKAGYEFPVEVFLQYIKPENEKPRFVAIVRDICERVEAQDKLHHLAHHDHLTGLPNRLLFLDRLERTLLRRNCGHVAVLFLDLDRFKVINDTLGHASGDQVLKILSKRLVDCIRKSDTLARLSGDEFAIILEDVASSDEVVPVVRNILDQFSQPFTIESRELFVTASIGISLSPDDGEDIQALLKNADIAMYRAKDLGRNTYQFYSSDMSNKALERLSLETDLRYALEREEYQLVYQPQLDQMSGTIIGCEALLRWNHPEFGLVGPDDFIPVLEDTGLIEAVGEWVLIESCKQAKIWQEKYDKDFRISVNISARQFRSNDLVIKIADCLEQTKLAAHTLELEITESILINNTDTIKVTMQELESLGLRIALDDFGTGYSSLSYLKQFPINTIKIDRSFVRDITTDEDDAAIVSAIIAIAKSLKMDLVAEGVETQQQLDFVADNGCAVIQGYLFSKPLSVVAMEKLLAKKNCDCNENLSRTGTQISINVD